MRKLSPSAYVMYGRCVFCRDYENLSNCFVQIFFFLQGDEKHKNFTLIYKEQTNPSFLHISLDGSVD